MQPQLATVSAKASTWGWVDRNYRQQLMDDDSLIQQQHEPPMGFAGYGQVNIPTKALQVLTESPLKIHCKYICRCFRSLCFFACYVLVLLIVESHQLKIQQLLASFFPYSCVGCLVACLLGCLIASLVAWLSAITDWQIISKQ